MNPLEKKLAPIEKILDAAWRDPDEALAWHTYGFSETEVRRFVDLGVLDPHTAKALDTLGVRPGMLELARKPLAAEANPPRCPECGSADLRTDTSGAVDCVGCGHSLEATPG